jgi:thiol-disulfide isomerase/thioredoxin
MWLPEENREIFMKRIICAFIILSLFGLAGCNRDKSGGKPAAKPASSAVEGAMAPDFTVKDLEAKEQKLSALKGKVVMVNFWATWCPPCKEEIPSMMKLNQSMAGKPFQMLAISVDEGGKAAVEGFFKKSGLSLPVYLDSDGAVSRSYGTTGVPETFIVDKNGLIQKKIVGGMDWSSPDVIAYMDELLKK